MPTFVHPAVHNVDRLEALDAMRVSATRIRRKTITNVTAGISPTGFVDFRQRKDHIATIGRVATAVVSPTGELRLL